MSKQDDLVAAIETAMLNATTGEGALDLNVALKVAVQTAIEAYVARSEEIAGVPVPVAPAAGLKAVVEQVAKDVVVGTYEEPDTLQWGASVLYGLNRARVGLEAYIAEKV